MTVLTTAQEVPIAQLLRLEPVTILGNETVGRAIDKMAEHGIRHLVVISPAGIVCGLISQRDTFRYLSENRNRVALVRDAMTAPVISADPEMPVSEAAHLLRKHRIGCLLIVSSSQKKLMGILTRSDVLEFLTSRFPIGAGASP